MYQIGDRVRCVGISDDSKRVLGLEGTVRAKDPYWNEDRIGVEWDQLQTGNDLNGQAQQGHGWWVNTDCIELIEDDLDEEPVDYDAFMETLGAV